MGSTILNQIIGVLANMKAVEEKSYAPPIKITLLRRVFIFILTPILKSIARIQIESVANLPMQGGAILAINHLSFLMDL